MTIRYIKQRLRRLPTLAIVMIAYCLALPIEIPIMLAVGHLTQNGWVLIPSFCAIMGLTLGSASWLLLRLEEGP